MTLSSPRLRSSVRTRIFKKKGPQGGIREKMAQRTCCQHAVLGCARPFPNINMGGVSGFPSCSCGSTEGRRGSFPTAAPVQTQLLWTDASPARRNPGSRAAAIQPLALPTSPASSWCLPWLILAIHVILCRVLFPACP